MGNPLFLIIQGFVLFLPAMAANSLAVVTGGIGKMDFGKSMRDGHRIFGDGKTWSGFLGGIALSITFGYIILGVDYLMKYPLYPYGYGAIYPLSSLVPMCAGSLTGDLAGSFTKRRIGIPSGGNAHLLDQIPFAIMSLIFIFVFDPSFFYAVYYNYFAIPFILIITPPIHRAVNIIGYRMNRKSVPW
ncbi:MAG: CDP-2,3-bis-(O-geranylgeranyl)-sn-glycerol synthase [Candidatus Thermoplasmatota archaeon]|nr:CDP-2,3-bis-(O-geranylgeranyl)-sn-glycerol synthase [Candidatus Thermoplasmatota archaeon]MCL5730631.1 CDP-2,3-bis-(O-geranylgeranyl)-sn-glycerol synthase [Candidatus Thermoplasmatota archaeon]